MNNVKRFVNRCTSWWTVSNGFVNRSTGRWTMSSSLLTGVRADEQCQAVCHQVYEMMNSVKRFCQQVYGPMNNVKQFVNRCAGRWIMSSGLSTGVRDDEQCQAVCQQVCEMMNNVKRFVNRCARWLTRSSGLAAEVLGCQWFSCYLQPVLQPSARKQARKDTHHRQLADCSLNPLSLNGLQLFYLSQ